VYLQQLAESCLHSYGMSVFKHASEPIYHFSYRNEQTSWTCYVSLNEQERLAEIHCRADDPPQSKYQDRISEFITMANQALPSGRFAQDSSDKRCYFYLRGVFPCLSLAQDTEQFHDLLRESLKQVDDHSVGFGAIDKGKTPEQALKLVAEERDSYDLFL